jgi:hypothetical protein
MAREAPWLGVSLVAAAVDQIPIAATRWKGVEVRQAKADAFAERLRPVLDGMAAMSANATAAELDRLGYATARGVKWTARAVINVRGRLGTGAFS